MEDKLIELETRYSYQEDLLQQLNEIVIKQQKQIDMQAQQLALLRGQVDEVLASTPAAGADAQAEKPPHY